jgi:hypothetical protein
MRVRSRPAKGKSAGESDGQHRRRKWLDRLFDHQRGWVLNHKPKADPRPPWRRLVEVYGGRTVAARGEIDVAKRSWTGKLFEKK